MRLSGRQQTLLGIYGAANDAKKKVFKKPQRPLSSSVKSTLGSRKTIPRRPSPFVRSGNEERRDAEPEQQPAAVQEVQNSNQSISPTSEGRRSSIEEEKGTEDPSPAVSRTTKRRMFAVKGERDEDVTGSNAVISLYGDGFLEVPLSPKGSESTESHQLSGNRGFSINMFLFKTADTEKHKAKVEADGARHKSPELDDTGDFVRWLCCGSTNRSIFGCSASLDEGTVAERKGSGFSSIFQGSSESTPKLLAARLRVDDVNDDVNDDEATFSIYDRGVLANYRDKGEDGGCRVRWRGCECWANNYEVPSNRWVHLKVVFDCRYLQIFFDNELVDCARIQTVEVLGSSNGGSHRGRRAGGSSAWVQAPSSTNSVYVGGHPSYAKSVRDWRARIGFVGLIASFQLWKVSSDQQQGAGNTNGSQHEAFISLVVPEVGIVRDNSNFGNVVNAHRNVFWRRTAPPIWTPKSHFSPAMCGVSPTTNGSIVLLGNFFDGAHQDVGVVSPKSFEYLLLSALQSGDIRVLIERAEEFCVQRTYDHVYRSQMEYEQKSSAVVSGIEHMSPLLNVVINSEDIQPPIGSFEISVELSRAAGRRAVLVTLHSMATTGCFPNLEEIKKKIESIVLFEAKRAPGEEISIQAFRHLLALASQSRRNRERTFIESVINRKLVLTEKKVSAEFEKIGFFFSSSELPEVVADLKRIQDNYSRAQSHRMDDLPSLSMLTPTPSGLYALPFMNTLLVSSTMMCDHGAPKSPWRFVCVLVDYDFQLVDFVHEGCPVTKRGGISYRQGQSIYNSVVDRVYLRLTALPSKVFCVLFALQKVVEDDANDLSDPSFRGKPHQLPGVRVQLENVEEHHVLGMFDAKPTYGCHWFTLAAAYRSKKNSVWQFQAIGGCGNATSIYASIDEVNMLLAELRIIQTYEVRVHFVETAPETENTTLQNRECEEFARRLAKNIRFGRNGRIVLIPLSESAGDSTTSKVRLRIALKLQEVENEIDVYTHRNAATRALPTIQSIYRSLLRILSQHGIKECLQQNPFAPQNKRVKRHVEFRVVSAQTNNPVDKVHVFVEKNIAFDALSSNLAKTVLPTLMMGSRLMSIRRRLQKKRVIEVTHEVAEAFVNDCIARASKRATIAAKLNLKLISVVRARALLRRVMRLRYEKIKGCIIERARKSGHAREYSQSFPLRLQRTFTNRLVLSESERDLLQHSTREELAELDLMLRGGTIPIKEKPAIDEKALLEEWTSKKAKFQDEHSETNSKKSDEHEVNSADNVVTLGDQGPELTGEPPGEVIKDRRQLFVTDSEGRARCRLIPGSYSLYVFHLDFFEWTSLAAVYPTITAAGLFSGPIAASSSVQEMVIPLDVYRWTYALQLVDYFNPHIDIQLAGIPLQITNNCSSERQIITTDANGCATWDVCKGLYAVDVLRECSCVLYSALKQVVVDGGRYRTSKTITMPVLFGGVKVTVLVVLAAPAVNANSHETSCELANICFQPASSVESSESAAAGKRRNATYPRAFDLSAKDERSDGDVALESSRAFKLRLGSYRLEVTLSECFSVSLPVKVSWASSRTQAKDGNRYLAVLSPVIKAPQTFRIVLSYVDAVDSIDVIIEVWKDNAMVGHVWRQNAGGCVQHVELETINSIEGCEYQSLLLHCQEGFVYKCIVASNLSMTHCLRPHVQIYSSAGLIYQCSNPPSIGELYWHVCWWNSNGVLVPTNSELSPSSDVASLSYAQR